MPIIIEFELLDEEKILLAAIAKNDLNLISEVLNCYFSEEYQEQKRAEEKLLEHTVRRVPDINAASGEAIFAAFATGNLAAIKLLVAKGGNLNLNRNYGYSSLTANPVWHYALVHFDNEGEILKFLLENNVPFGKRELYDALKIDNVAAFALLFKRYIALLKIADSSQAFQEIIKEYFFYTFPTYIAIKPSPKVARVILEEFVADSEFKKELVMDGFCKELLATWDREENFQYFIECAQALKINLNQNFLQRFDKISGGIGHYDFLTLLDIAILSQKTAYVFLLLMSGVEFNLKNKLEILEHKSSAYYSIKEFLHVAAAHDLLASLKEENDNLKDLISISEYIEEAFRIELDNKQPNAAWSDDGEKLLILLVNGRVPLNQFQLDKLYEIFEVMGIANNIAHKKNEFQQAIDEMSQTIAAKAKKYNDNVDKNEIDRHWSQPCEKLTNDELIDEEKILLALIEKEASDLIGKVLDLYFSAEYLVRKRAEEVKLVGIPFCRVLNINAENGKLILAAFQTKNLGIIKLLVAKGADLNLKEDWRTSYGTTVIRPLWQFAINHFANHKEIFEYLLAQNAECDEKELHNLIQQDNPEAFALLFTRFAELKKLDKNSSDYREVIENFFLREAMPWGHSGQGKIGIVNCILSQLIDDQEFKKELVADGLFITLVTTLGNNPDFLQALLKMAKTYDVDLNKKFSRYQGKSKLIANLVMDVWWWEDGSTHVSFLDICIRQGLGSYVLPLLLVGVKFELEESLKFVPRDRFDDSTRRLLYLATAHDLLATLHENQNDSQAEKIKKCIEECIAAAIKPESNKTDKNNNDLNKCCIQYLMGLIAGERVALTKFQLAQLMAIPKMKDICFNVAPMQVAIVLGQHNLYPEKVVPLCLKLLYSLPSDTEVINKDEILRTLEKMAGFEKKENSRMAQENDNKYFWSKSPLKVDAQFSYLFFVALLLQARLFQLDEIVLSKNCDKFLMSFSFSKYDSIWTGLLFEKTLEQLSCLLAQDPNAVINLLQKESNNVFKQENFFTAVLQQIFLMSKVSLKDNQSSINYLIGTLMTLGFKEVEKVEEKVIFPAI